MGTNADKFLATVKAAGEAGIETKELEKMFGSRQMVYTAAHYAKKTGTKISCLGGRYIINNSTTKEEGVNLNVRGLYVSEDTLMSMDISSRSDLIEQIRRSQLHLNIAKSIIDSYKFLIEMKEKML
jgi:hypothetical protein